MNKILFFLVLCFATLFTKAQLPTIHATTIIPQSPTTSDIVKIVTHVSTPYQGIIVDLIHTVTHNPKEIELKPCYWQGMLTAVQNHIDTFVVGQLQAGVYTIKHKAYMSSTQQHCTKMDSNMVTTNITVSGLTTGINETDKSGFYFYPNPVNDRLFIKGFNIFSAAELYQFDGRLIKTVAGDEQESLNVSQLPKGVYFLRLTGSPNKTIKFIKE